MSRIPEVTLFNPLSAAGGSRQAPANSRVEDLVGKARRSEFRQAQKSRARGEQRSSAGSTVNLVEGAGWIVVWHRESSSSSDARSSRD